MSTRRPGPFRGRLGRHALRIFGWLVGAPLATFRFLRRKMPVEEIDVDGAALPLPVDEPDDVHQEREQAVGPVVHRLYSATIARPKLSARQLVDIIAADPNVIAPAEVLRFERSRGDPGDLREGDELLIRMAGPWNAPVGVTRRWDEGFRLAAVRGNPQLGQVDLQASDQERGIDLQIQTRERAAGLSFRLLQRSGLVRRMQTYTWTEMLENAAQLAGGLRPERVTVKSWCAETDG